MDITTLDVDVIGFDVDGTLVTTRSGERFRKTADDWKWLPGRLLILQQLVEAGKHLFLASNQGSVGFGYMREEDLAAEFGKMASLIGITMQEVLVCYTHPAAKIEQYKVSNDPRRKPRPGMIIEGMALYHTTSLRTLYVGDRYEDRDAAKAASVSFLSAIQFFGDRIDPAFDYAREGTFVAEGYVDPYRFHRGEKHF